MDLNAFPVVIDPATNLIEARSTTGKSHDMTVRWSVLHRLVVRPDQVEFAVPPSAVHFFGDADDVTRCSFLLIYDATGLWRHWAVKERGVWGLADVPVEASGGRLTTPSVRLEFPSPADAHDFCQAMVACGRDPDQLFERQDEILRLLGLVKDVHEVPVAALSGT